MSPFDMGVWRLHVIKHRQRMQHNAPTSCAPQAVCVDLTCTFSTEESSKTIRLFPTVLQAGKLVYRRCEKQQTILRDLVNIDFTSIYYIILSQFPVVVRLGTPGSSVAPYWMSIL